MASIPQHRRATQPPKSANATPNITRPQRHASEPSERETPMVLDVADVSHLPRTVAELGSATPRLFDELLSRGAGKGPIRAHVKSLAYALRLDRNTITRAAKSLTTYGYLVRDTHTRPQTWRLYLRPRKRDLA